MPLFGITTTFTWPASNCSSSWAKTLIVAALKEQLLDGPLGRVQSLVVYMQRQPHRVQVGPTFAML